MAQSPAVNLRRGGSWGGGEGNVFKGRGRGGGVIQQCTLWSINFC